MPQCILLSALASHLVLSLLYPPTFYHFPLHVFVKSRYPSRALRTFPFPPLSAPIVHYSTAPYASQRLYLLNLSIALTFRSRNSVLSLCNLPPFPTTHLLHPHIKPRLFSSRKRLLQFASPRFNTRNLHLFSSSALPQLRSTFSKPPIRHFQCFSAFFAISSCKVCKELMQSITPMHHRTVYNPNGSQTKRMHSV